MNYILVNILEFFYILYFFTIFKTKYSIHHPFEYINNNFSFLKHPIYTGIYENKICIFGHMCAYLSSIYFLYRSIFYYNNNKKEYTTSTIILPLIMILSFIMNINSFIYLIPIFFIEFYLIYN